MNRVRKVDYYILLEEISKNGEKSIYLGLDDRNDKLVSIKVIPKKTVSKEDSSKIINEIRILKKLKHENIVKLKELKQTDNNYLFIFEYYNGGKLSDYMKYYHETNKNQLNEIYIQNIIRQITSGLEFIHLQNVIHRGITLDNIAINYKKYPNILIKGKLPPKVQFSKISLNDSFTLKIENMKFAKNMENNKFTSTIVGNPQNMAPDMLFNNRYNNKVDLWSLGVITYELLTGEKPFLGDNRNEIYNKIKEGKYNLPKSLIASYEIISFINGLLQFNAEKRMDWPQIKKHPFLIKNVDDFTFIELNAVKSIDKDIIEMNTKNNDNLLWILYNGKNINFNIDKLNINSDENEKKEMEKIINENKVNNEDIQKVREEKKINIEEEKKRLKEEIKKAEKLKNEGELKINELKAKNEEKDKIEIKIKELESKLKNDNENENIKKEIEESQQKYNELFEITNNADKLLANANKIIKEDKKKLISIRISEIIPDESLSALKNEKDILNLFFMKEKEINNWIFYNLGKNIFLNEFAQTSLEEIFKNNNYISEITKNIYTKLEDINLDLIESEDDYNIKLNSIFGDVLLPKFLINKYLKGLQDNFFNKFTEKRHNTVENRMSNINKRSFTIETKTIIEYYENIKSSKINVFENINNKNELFDFFVLVNYKIFQKPYFNKTFFSFLKYNEQLIKQYFGENTKYNELFEKLDYKELNNKKEELFNIIKENINMNTDKLYIIIASFFYLLFYKFKDVKEIKGRTNIGNVYINVVLKKYVKFFGQRLDNLNKNLIDLLNELYFFDLNNSNDENNKKTNNSYSFEDISNLMSKCSDLTIIFTVDEKEYQEAINKDMSFLTYLGKKCNEKLLSTKFYLKPVDKNVYSNTITIIIDMLEYQDKENEWIKFIKYFDKETIFYFLKWSYFLKKTLYEKENITNVSNAKNLSKICGKILADILFSNQIFNNFQINLVGFSLGANVVKYCLKQLSMLNESSEKKYVKIKNVILIGAATHIKKEDKWKELIKTTVIDRFINCYSNNDEKLKDFYFICSKSVNKLHKLPIGLNSLELKDDKGNNLVRNFDFTEDNYEQLSYEFEKVAEKIFPKFKDI